MFVKYNIDKRIKTKKLDDFLSTPIIISVNKFNEASAKEFVSSMIAAHNTGQDIIPVFIDSYGGQVYSLLNMVDMIEKSELPVATIIEGKAMSCGAILAACGTKGQRYVAPHATIMIHDVSSGSFGKAEEIKASAKEVERLNKMIYKKLAQSCGKDDKYFWDLVHKKGRADWYLTPKDLVKYKLADKIGLPTLELGIKVSYKFGL
tara:strand:- start:1337 stop:1951 length:615 start_codon:yes stop_codon:yes gene_type:complete